MIISLMQWKYWRYLKTVDKELIIKFSSHPSINRIKEIFNVSKRFHLIHTYVEKVRVKICELDHS